MDQEISSPTKPKTVKMGKVVYEATWNRFAAPLGRGLSQLFIQLAIISCFGFAAKSGTNGGIIATIFSTSTIFSIIIFYFKYGQKVTKIDYLGTLLIMTCVVLVALGGAGGSSSETSEEDKKEKKFYLALALAFALLSGFVLTLNTVSVQHTIMTGFELDQANYDGGAMIGLLFLPFYFAFIKRYSNADLLVATIVVVLVTIGVIFFSRAL
jgi:drug/metabolite transporter (DMT)-like permease